MGRAGYYLLIACSSPSFSGVASLVSGRQPACSVRGLPASILPVTSSLIFYCTVFCCRLHRQHLCGQTSKQLCVSSEITAVGISDLAPKQPYYSRPIVVQYICWCVALSEVSIYDYKLCVCETHSLGSIG